MPSQLFTVVPDARFIVLQLQVPNMDSEACDALEMLLAEQIEQRDASVVVDLTRAKFLPSLAIGSLIHVKRTLDQHNRNLMLVGLSPNIRKALELNNLDRIFPIAPDLAAAEGLVQQMQR